MTTRQAARLRQATAAIPASRDVSVSGIATLPMTSTHALATLTGTRLGANVSPDTHVLFGVAQNGRVTHCLGIGQAFFVDVLPGSILFVCVRREHQPPHAYAF